MSTANNAADTANNEPFTISTDRASGMMMVTLRGHWNLDDAKRYRSELAEVMGRNHREIGGLRILFDASDMPLPSGEVAEAVVDAVKCESQDRFATVLGTTLAVMGARRRLSENDPGCTWNVFESAADARRWLLEG